MVKQHGFSPLILILLAALGIIIYLLLSSSAPFKNVLLNFLYPKPSSHAQEVKAESVPDEILVKFKADISESDKENIRKEQGLEKKDEITQIGVERVKVKAENKDKVIEALSHNPEVKYAEPNYLGKQLYSPNDPEFTNGTQWYLNTINAPQAWDISKGSSSTVIAIPDSGIRADHEDLSSKIVPGWNFISGNSDTADVNGHGTNIAGVAAGATNNSLGIAGTCPICSIMPLVVSNSIGSPGVFATTKAITYAADNGAKVINISLGWSLTVSSIQSAINYAWNKGVIIVAAAGNFAASPILYPASEPVVIAVGMTYQDDTWANSNYGTGLDVMAPGLSIYTTDWSSANGYATVNGTSFSSPMVAGLIGLIISVNPNLTPQQITDIITQTADKVGGVTYDATGWNDHYGYGRINAYKALQMATGITPLPTSSPSPTSTSSPSPTSTSSPSPTPSDITPPIVSITNPLNNSIVKVNSKVNITANASDNIGVTKVEFYVNNTLKCTDTTSSYSCSWAVPGKKNTNYTIKVIAYDLSNNSTSASITVKAQ